MSDAAQINHDLHDLVDELLARFDRALFDDDPALAGELLAELSRVLGSEDPEAVYCGARLAWQQEGPPAAQAQLLRVLELDDTHADAHYDLGCLAEERGDDARKLQHFLRVRALDAELDQAAGLGSAQDFDTIEREARAVLDALPEPFSGRLAHVPVIIERRPSRDLVAEGFDPRAFGLFEGPTDAMQGQSAETPTRIVLYACNLLAEFPAPGQLAEQIEVTVLHEVGHFFGLDEDDLERLGLS
jgi:predicted Zn-dependent protease with MMP-like domain